MPVNVAGQGCLLERFVEATGRLLILITISRPPDVFINIYKYCFTYLEASASNLRRNQHSLQ